MSPKHSELHEELLLELVETAARPREAVAGSELWDCPQCAEHLEQWLETRAALGATAQEERALLEEAARERGAPGEEELAGLRERLADLPPPPSPWPFVRMLVAAAVLIAILVPWWRSALRESSSTFLGDDLLRSAAPVGEVRAWQGFHWEGDWPPDASFEVRVYGEADEPLATSERLQETGWTPEASETLTWPDRIRWELSLFDASGALFDTYSNEAWRP